MEKIGAIAVVPAKVECSLCKIFTAVNGKANQIWMFKSIDFLFGSCKNPLFHFTLIDEIETILPAFAVELHWE